MSESESLYFDPSDTTAYEFIAPDTPEKDRGSASVETAITGLHGHTVTLYNSLAAYARDELSTKALTGVRDVLSDDGKRRGSEYVVNATGLSIEQVCAWIKRWSFTQRNGRPLDVSPKRLGYFNTRTYDEIAALVEQHQRSADLEEIVAVDPQEATESPAETAGTPTSVSDPSSSADTEPATPTN